MHFEVQCLCSGRCQIIFVHVQSENLKWIFFLGGGFQY